MSELSMRPAQDGQQDGKVTTTLRAKSDAQGAKSSAQGAKSDAQAAMDALCRSVAEVLRVTPSAPTRLRVQIGGALVVVEWSDDGAAPAASTEPESTPGQPTHYVVSAPLVGTVYRAPEPDAPPFVEIGDVVAAGDQVAIIEAMKLMNPVHADQAGRLAEVFIENGTAVEYGQPLLAFEPVAAEAAT